MSSTINITSKIDGQKIKKLVFNNFYKSGSINIAITK